MTTQRKIEITFTEKEKRVDIGMIASAIAKTMREGEKTNGKRKKVL